MMRDKEQLFAEAMTVASTGEEQLRIFWDTLTPEEQDAVKEVALVRLEKIGELWEDVASSFRPAIEAFGRLWESLQEAVVQAGYVDIPAYAEARMDRIEKEEAGDETLD